MKTDSARRRQTDREARQARRPGNRLTAIDTLTSSTIAERENISQGESTFTYKKKQPSACQVTFLPIPQPQPPTSLN